MSDIVRFIFIIQFLLYSVQVSSLENLALGKPTWELNPWPKKDRNFSSQNAEDGLKNDRGIVGQCTISDDGKYTAEWRVDLGSVVSISRIDIYYRTDNQPKPSVYVGRMAGFSIYVSNTTSKEEGQLCFHDNSTTEGKPSEDQIINCSIYGRYVIYYNERIQNVTYPSYYSKYAYNELCEVEVYGCRDTFAYECMSPCSINCPESQCDSGNGYCNSCFPGYYGSTCEVCLTKTYGLGCSMLCGNCSNGETCHHVSGKCPYGCDAGAWGSQCQEKCYTGLYGKNCLNQCGENCWISNKCDRFTGQCEGGCKSGWTGNTCRHNCEYGYYGINCSNICNTNCKVNSGCDRFTGTCNDGCEPGWTGDLCNQKCHQGHYGRDCSKTCSVNCNLKDQCDRFNGHCDEGCKPGWTGDTCDQECSAGLFGTNCVNQCSDNCNLTRECDRLTGQCDGGCIAGWNGATCNDTCDDTFYGINCTQLCGSNCVNYSCNHVTGICKVYLQPLKDTDPDNLPGVIGGTTAASIIIILIVALLVLYKRIRCSSVQKRTEQYTNAAQNTMAFSNLYQTIDIHVEENAGVINTEMKQKLGESKKPIKIRKSRDRKDEDVDIDEKIHEENPYGDFYVNEEPLLDFGISYLENIIEEKSKSENDGFKKEYATLLYGEKYPCNVGRLPENIPKNRFKTTFPYDHSRVILANKRADYINANYIDGITEENIYIATQGPKQNTVADFWLMIWQEDVKQVVMLTSLTEGTKWKCFQYWPNLQTTMDCGMFSIHLIEEKQYGFYITRKITVTNKKSKDDRRTVIQYHYTAWPDHGIPEPLCLLLFRDHVTRTKYCGHTGPILVHCSAGIGRTGTYIAIDVLSEAGKTRSKINIAEYVMKMRRNRMNMVQTYEQYKTIFLTLHEMFKAPPTVLSAAEFLQKSQTEIIKKPANSSTFKKEFQKLLAVRPQYTEKDYKVTSQFHDPSASIQPLDKYVLFLTSNVPKRGSYINAITVPSFTNENAFIITNYPTQGDTVDFLRLITDYDSEVVVCIEPVCNIESASKWLPTTTRSKQVTPFTVKLEHEQTTEIKRSEIEITKEGFNGKAWSVEIAEPLNGLKTNNEKTVIHFLSLVLFARNIDTERPIIVMSCDGAAMCGVFCAVYNLIQQLTMDEEIDVFSVVRLLQTRRPELCSTKEEYQLIHETLQSFIKTHMGENIYCNQ